MSLCSNLSTPILALIDCITSMFTSSMTKYLIRSHIAANGVIAFRRCFISSQEIIKTIAVTQGGSIHIHAHETLPSTIHITAAWQDHCDLLSSSSMPMILQDNTNTNSAVIRMMHADAQGDGGDCSISLSVPEICNIHINGREVDVTIKKKVG
jgi:hypothetical protein